MRLGYFVCQEFVMDSIKMETALSPQLRILALTSTNNDVIHDQFIVSHRELAHKPVTLWENHVIQ